MKIAIYLLVSINEICCLEYYCVTVSRCYAVTRLSVLLYHGTTYSGNRSR